MATSGGKDSICDIAIGFYTDGGHNHPITQRLCFPVLDRVPARDCHSAGIEKSEAAAAGVHQTDDSRKLRGALDGFLESVTCGSAFGEGFLKAYGAKIGPR